MVVGNGKSNGKQGGAGKNGVGAKAEKSEKPEKSENDARTKTTAKAATKTAATKTAAKSASGETDVMGGAGSKKGASNGQARFRIGVFALIERDGLYLLARRSDIGWWNLPGGGLEYGESLAEGLAREVQEEVQLAVTVGQLVGVYEKPLKREVVLAFRCHMIDESATPGLSDEVSEVGWFAPDALPEQTLPKHAQRVRDAALRETAALVREQATATEDDQRVR